MGKITLGNLDISKISIGTKDVSKIYLGNIEIYSGEEPIPVDPILENNSGATIRAVCESGKAANYGSVGDTKEGLIGTARCRFRIVDMTIGRYKDSNNKNNNVVFEIEGCFNSTVPVGNCVVSKTDIKHTSTNSNQGGGDQSLARVGLNDTFKATLSQDLQDVLTRTGGIKTMNGGNQSGVVLTTSQDYLFFAAEKEIFGTQQNCSEIEANALTQFKLYELNNTNEFRIKYSLVSRKQPQNGGLRSTVADSAFNFSFVVGQNNSRDGQLSADGGDGNTYYPVPFFPM